MIYLRTRTNHQRCAALRIAHSKKQIFDVYYLQRQILLERLSGKIRSLKISGKEYQRRVQKVNKWTLYKIQRGEELLIIQEIKDDGTEQFINGRSINV